MSERVLSQEECAPDHDLFWTAVNREQQAWCCRRCGYAYDNASKREVRSELMCLTPTSGLPDGLFRGWMPIFPLEYV